MSDLLRRQRALEKTLARYRRRRFAIGEADCVRMARSHLVAMGHRPPALPRYRNLTGALRALNRMGFDSLEALFDSLLPKIPPAAMLPGDIALLQGEGPLDATVISVGHKVFGFHQDEETTALMIPHEIKAAWRA